LGTGEKQAASALVRLRRTHRMFSPFPGLYFPVPPEYRTWGALPATYFIDSMMRAAQRSYYVAFLSAAELHGAAHQRPQVFQVMVNRRLHDRDFARVRVRFYQDKNLVQKRTVDMNSAVGHVRVSTPEITALDLASNLDAGGGLSNVATVLTELADDHTLDISQLASDADHYPIAVVRRIGWLLDTIARIHDLQIETEVLLAALRARSGASRSGTLAVPSGARRGHTDSRWDVVENAPVEIDL
ncbi:MAG: type IV toxin-antitoxin system AbiEi family antitoxin, partial [Actinomycetales bacterium]|nr:type IV toxin-antitoxin system AbiEi family antitoxin [Actinomycetales bacterium]